MVRLWGGWEILFFAHHDEGIVIGAEINWGTRQHPSFYLRIMAFGLSVFRRDPPNPLRTRRVRAKRTVP